MIVLKLLRLLQNRHLLVDELSNFTINILNTSQMGSLNFNYSNGEFYEVSKKEKQPLKLSINLIIELISNEIEASRNSKVFEKLMLQKHLISNENN